jgi:hypothetical protein
MFNLHPVIEIISSDGSIANERGDDWPDLIPLAEFAINDAASPLARPSTPISASAPAHPMSGGPVSCAGAAGPGQPGNAELDSHRRDVRFAVGDEVLLDTEHAPPPPRSLLSPRWMRPFAVLACPASNTYRPALPAAAWRVCPDFNVERLGPDLRRSDTAAPPPFPAVLVRWAGRDASGDTREPLDRLTNCEEAIAAFERATGRSIPRPAAAPPVVPGAPRRPSPPQVFRSRPRPVGGWEVAWTPRARAVAWTPRASRLARPNAAAAAAAAAAAVEAARRGSDGDFEGSPC